MSNNKPELAVIVAIAQNRAIGLNNKLLWHIPSDLKRFKRLTSGHTVIMGRNTFLSLPGGALPNRKNVVISHLDESFERCTIVHTPEQAIEACRNDELAFIIGGGMVYERFLPEADKLFLTVVHHDYEADTWFPEIDFQQWIKKSATYIDNDPDFAYPYSFIDFERKK